MSHCNGKLGAIALAVLLLAGCLPAADLHKAEDLFMRTDYQGSLALLDANTSDSATNFLLGRNNFMSGEFKKAQDYFEKAAGENPHSSEIADWLGRAYGKRAEIGNPLTAPVLASKARQAFERSVQLDGRNPEALDDLFDFYLEAPGFLGGGYDKAAKVADQLSVIDPGEGYYDRAKLDQKHKAFDRAEQHLRAAVQVAPHSVGHLIALAKFLANQGRISESEAVFAHAHQVSPNNPRVIFAQADLYVKQKRNLQAAKDLLEQYMRTPISADDPPREEAARLLKQVSGS